MEDTYLESYWPSLKIMVFAKVSLTECSLPHYKSVVAGTLASRRRETRSRNRLDGGRHIVLKRDQ